jgi:hypothetical protein
MKKDLSEILFEIDPAGTCCKQNDCFDEYDSIAAEIEHDYDQHGLFQQAVVENFEFYFEMQLEDEDLKSICDKFFDE